MTTLLGLTEFAIAQFEKVVEKTNERYAKRVEAMQNLWSEANDMLAPNIDSRGRLHAPCSGYALPQHVDYCVDVDPEHLYRKGEFLPVPLSTDEDAMYFQQMKSANLRNRFTLREKIKVDLDFAEEITAELNGNSYVTFSHGKSWEVNGKPVCYLYLNSIVNAVFNDFVNLIRNVVENNDKHIFTGVAPEGRQKVKGKIVKITDAYMFSDITLYPTDKVYIILDNDSSCYGTLPSGDFHVGDIVEFTATFTHSKASHHAFYKRPHKMTVVESAVEEA